MASKSIEEVIEDLAKNQLKDLKYYTKTEHINPEIENALKIAPSKSGGSGSNFPDIKLFLEYKGLRKIPVVIEVKGTKGKLIKEASNGEIANKKKDGTPHFTNIKTFAVNGAVHYAEAILEHTETYKEVIAIGINGYKREDNTVATELGVYYISSENFNIPKKISNYTDLTFLLKCNQEELISKLEEINLTNEELEAKAREYEYEIELKLKNLNQIMQDNLKISVGSRVELVSGMIMAGLGVDSKVSPLEIVDLKGEEGSKTNDGYVVINKIDSFLEERKLPQEKKNMIINDLSRVFIYSNLWTPINGESKIKSVYAIVKKDILPIFTSAKHLDFTGKLFNVLNEWVDIPDSDKNDVVLTPRYVTDLMAQIANVNMNSFVWDYATGSAGFLISSMKLMIQDAQNRIGSKEELSKKITAIKYEQLLGIEKRSDIYMLAVLNMILMGDGSSNILHKDSLIEYEGNYEQGEMINKVFPANVFLLNPPYSAEGKGFVFVNKALEKMKAGRAVVLIQENAGSGKGLPYTKEILKNNTLVASIHMSDIFKGKAGVQTAIYVFDIGTPHNAKSMVKFIDFSNDGYLRQNKKKSKKSNVNLKDVDNATGRYTEVLNLILYGKSYLNYLTEDEYIEDTITLNGDDWTFSQHVIIDNKPNIDDFNKTVKIYIAWKTSEMILGHLKKERMTSKKMTDNEEGAISSLKNDNIKYADFKIGELFDVHPTKSYGLTNAELHKIKGNVPVLSNSSINNGIAEYIGLKPTEKGNMITFSDTTVGADTIFYQPLDYVGYSHVQGMYPYIKDNWNENTLLYFIATFKRTAGKQFDFSKKFSRDIVSDMLVKLPVISLDSNEIDFEHMNNLISAIKKTVTKNIF
jgi:hypothetical protein